LVKANGKMSLGGMTCTDLQLGCKTYNGIPMLAPLNVSYDMSNSNIIAALTASFGCGVTIR
jgi:hypothetical protein